MKDGVTTFVVRLVGGSCESKRLHRLGYLVALALSLWCGLSECLQAQLTVDRVFPPAVVVGTETVVTAEGKFPHWPPSIFCDSKNVTVSAGKDSGKLAVKVVDEAMAGVAWIRLGDQHSMTALVPLLLSPVNVYLETEPNEKRSQANPIDLPVVVAGRLAKAGDSDAYRLSVKSGQTLVVSATANQVLQSPMDAVLQLTDVKGNVLMQSDDVRGLDPQMVFVANHDQELIIRIFAFPETPNSTIGFGGSAAFIYTLDVTTGPFVDHVASDGERIVPFGYNLGPPHVGVLDHAKEERTKNTNGISPPIATVPGALGWSWLANIDDRVDRCLPDSKFDGSLPALLYGHFTKPGQTHQYEFLASKGARYRAEVRSKSDGFLLDSKLTIIEKTSGKRLATKDDVSKGRYDPEVDFTALRDGQIQVTVSEALGEFGPRHFYQLRIHRSKPEYRLSVSNDHFVASLDKPLEIVVSVNRTSGFNQKVQVVAKDLPAGFSSQPVISEPKGNTAKSVKLKLIAGEDAVGNDDVSHRRFRIVGSVFDSDNEPGDNTCAASFRLRPEILINDFWITVPPAKTDNTKP